MRAPKQGRPKVGGPSTHGSTEAQRYHRNTGINTLIHIQLVPNKLNINKSIITV